MFRSIALAVAAALAFTSATAEQISSDPFPAPLEATKDLVVVDFVEFATIPDADGGEAPRLMHMVTEAGTKRLFAHTMRGMLYSLSYDGKKVTPYLDVNASEWKIEVEYTGMPERGMQSFAFHPQFAEAGKPGYGKFYTYTDVKTKGTPDFNSPAPKSSHDEVLLEWTAKNASAERYDGGAPKELFRIAKPYPNHNGGQVGFNPLAKRGAEDFGLLYVGFADGGAGGDPMNMAQNLSLGFGKILRIDPLGSNSKNGRYGIPASNPFVNDGKDDTLGEIYAYGLRNPQRFTWDAKDGRMLVADIGQNLVEEISPVTKGGNLGWVKWEGSYKYVKGQVDLDNPRSEAGLVWPLVEYDHKDPLLQFMAAITGLTVYRGNEIKQLSNTIVFGDITSGELFYAKADAQLNGGPGAIRRILLNDGGKQKTLLQLANEKLASKNKPAGQRADLRFGFGPKGQIFVMNKRDGVIRLLVPNGAKKPAL